MFNAFLKARRARADSIRRLHAEIVRQAREPVFYGPYSVPDTIDGRFDMVVLHAVLVMDRLRATGDAGVTLSQALFDHVFRDFDRSLREMGSGDLGVGKRIKAMAKAFYGRMDAYVTALRGDDAALEDALRRNLFAKTDPHPRVLAAMSTYVRREAQSLAITPAEDLHAGRFTFEAPPTETIPGSVRDPAALQDAGQP